MLEIDGAIGQTCPGISAIYRSDPRLDSTMPSDRETRQRLADRRPRYGVACHQLER